MATGSQAMTSFYAKRIIGDSVNSLVANDGLLQVNVSNTKLVTRSHNNNSAYYIAYVDDTTAGIDIIEFQNINLELTNTAGDTLTFSTSTIESSGELSVNATSTSAVIFGGNIHTNGAITIGNLSGLNLILDNHSIFAREWDSTNEVYIDSALSLGGDTSIDGYLNVVGDFYSGGDIYLAEAKSIFMNYTVPGEVGEEGTLTDFPILVNNDDGTVSLNSLTGALFLGYRNTEVIHISTSDGLNENDWLIINEYGPYATTNLGIGDQDTQGNYILYVNGNEYLAESLTLGGTTASTALINFSREGINYIDVPVNGYLGFTIGGAQESTIQAMIGSGMLNCYSNKRSALGTSNIRWSALYSGSGDFDEDVYISGILGCDFKAATNGRHYSNLAMYDTTTATVTGTFKITLPNTTSNCVMMVCRIIIYEYNSDSGTEILVSGYTYNNSTWYNYNATTVGSYKKEIRLAYDGTHYCILLGTTSTAWNCPRVVLADVYSGYRLQPTSPYSVTLITDETGYTISATIYPTMALNRLHIYGPTTGTMTADSTNPRITFSEGVSTQPVHLIYSDWDSYRAPAGLKVIGGTSATPAWFEVEGNIHARALNLYPGEGSYREGIRIHSYGSWSDITLCGNDNTGASGTSANSWFLGNNNGNFYISRNGSPGTTAWLECVDNIWSTMNPLWIKGGSTNAGSNTNRLTTTSGMPGNMQYNQSRRGTQIYANGIAFADPYNGNSNSDAGWIRHQETTSNAGELEIAVGDDGDEIIVVRQYNTSNGIKRTLTLLSKDGYTFIPSYLNIGGHEKNASSPTYVWGSNSSDSYLRSYQTSKLSVATAASCTGNAATASKVGEAATWLYFNHSNEVNFGGTGTSDTIYFGYRATDSRPKPATFIFGTSSAMATVKAATFVGALTGNVTGNCSGSSGSCTGNAATATTASKLGTNAGNANTPVYFSGGVPVATNNKLGAISANGYWGMRGADNGDSWIRTTSSGIIPVQSGSKGSGHCGLGTSSWYFSSAYIDTITSNKTYGAVWNDIAECRDTEIKEPGRVVVETGNKMTLSTERLQATARIISDTYGYCMGEPAEDGTPIAIAGRVLVYPYQNRDNYKLGDAVCAAPNGTVDIMTREEIKEYPDRIIGIVSEIPKYDKYEPRGGGGEYAQINGRIWIYVR